MAYKLNENEQYLIKDWKDIYKDIYIMDTRPLSLISSKQPNGDYYIYNSDRANNKSLIFVAKNEEEVNYVKKKAKEYSDILDTMVDVEVTGERKISDDMSIIIKKSNAAKEHMVYDFIIMKNDSKIGQRTITANPFFTYLQLGIFTISGSSSIEKNLIGKGVGKLLYDTVDKILPYQQIPHGYAGACGGLTKYSDAFWKKRNEHKTIPLVDENIQKRIEEIYEKALYPINDHFLNGLLKVEKNMKNGYAYAQNGSNLCPLCLYPEHKDKEISIDDIQDKIRQKIKDEIRNINFNGIFEDKEAFMKFIKPYHFADAEYHGHEIIQQAIDDKYEELKDFKYPDNIKVWAKNIENPMSSLFFQEICSLYIEKKDDNYCLGKINVDGENKLFEKTILFQTQDLDLFKNKVELMRKYIRILQDEDKEKYGNYTKLSFSAAIEGHFLCQHTDDGSDIHPVDDKFISKEMGDYKQESGNKAINFGQHFAKLGDDTKADFELIYTLEKAFNELSYFTADNDPYVRLVDGNQITYMTGKNEMVLINKEDIPYVDKSDIIKETIAGLKKAVGDDFYIYLDKIQKRQEPLYPPDEPTPLLELLNIFHSDNHENIQISSYGEKSPLQHMGKETADELLSQFQHNPYVKMTPLS